MLCTTISTLVLLSNSPNIATNFIIPDAMLKITAHITVFFLIGSFYLRSAYQFKAKFMYNFVVYLLLGLAFAFFDEYQQSFVPSRQASIVDVYFDLLGLLAANILFNLSLFKNKKKYPEKSKQKVLMVTSKQTADALFQYIYKDRNSEFSIGKILIWDEYSIKPNAVQNRFYVNFDEIYQTIYEEKWDKIIFIGKDKADEKLDIVQEVADKTHTPVVFIDSSIKPSLFLKPN